MILEAGFLFLNDDTKASGQSRGLIEPELRAVYFGHGIRYGNAFKLARCEIEADELRAEETRSNKAVVLERGAVQLHFSHVR